MRAYECTRCEKRVDPAHATPDPATGELVHNAVLNGRRTNRAPSRCGGRLVDAAPLPSSKTAELVELHQARLPGVTT